MNRNFKDYRLKLLVIMLLLITFSCEKDTQNDIVAQKSFIVPSIEVAKSYFNANSKYAASTSIQSKNSQSTSYVDWEQSKEKTYKETPQEDIDILYTPRYINTEQEIKSFVASTTYNGVVESKIFFILYKNLEITNGLSGFVFIYNLDGQLEAHYNYQNGQQIAFPNNSNTATQSKTSTNCDEIPIGTLEEFEQWSIACHSVQLDEVLIIGGSTDSTTTGGSTTIFDGPQWNPLDLPYVYPDPDVSVNTTGSNSNWWVSNTLTANGFAIMEAIEPFANLTHLDWLDNVATTDQLIAIANYLNQNRVRAPKEPINDTDIGDNGTPDFNPSQYTGHDEDAVQHVTEILNSAADGTLITALPFFKYPDGTNYADIYPELTWLLQEHIPSLKNNTHLINTITSLTGISEEEAKNHLTWDNGPEIHITDLGFAPDGTAYKGKFNPSEPNNIYIDVDLVEYIEQYAVTNGETTTLGALRSLLIFGVCLHELVHFADFDFDGLMQDNVNLELGELFEQIAIGGHYEFNPNGEVIFIKIDN